jgi:hypothetical protein
MWTGATYAANLFSLCQSTDLSNLIVKHRVSIKDIIQPKKRRVKRVTNRFVLPFCTIDNILFEHMKAFSHVLNLEKPVSVFMAKKVWSLLMWSPLPKTQRHVKTLRHSPCDNTPNAAIVATKFQKYCFLFPYSLRSTAVAIHHLSLLLRWRHLECRHTDCSDLSNIRVS